MYLLGLNLIATGSSWKKTKMWNCGPLQNAWILQMNRGNQLNKDNTIYNFNNKLLRPKMTSGSLTIKTSKL